MKPNVAIWYNSRCELMELEDMMYPFMTLDDDTEIVHSEMFEDGKVKVYVEKPVEGGFHSAVCMLPGYEWSEINGLDESEMARCSEVIKSTAHLIMRFAKNGGYANASGF